MTDKHSEHYFFSPLVTTKLRPPRYKGSLVTRKNNHYLLEQAQEARMVLVSAPAGFGKTTLLTQWYQQLTAKGFIVTWLALDKDDLYVFSRYLLEGFKAQGVSLAVMDTALEHTSAEICCEMVTAVLINALEERSEEFFLLLDDYHLITDPWVHKLVDRLTMLSPENLHLVISTRTKPPLALVPLRAHGQLLEVSIRHLRLDFEECRKYMENTLPTPLSEKSLWQLYERTEGWVVALQLATLALKHHKNPDSYIEKFSGDTRNIEELLTEDVFNNLSVQIQEFLLNTSILDLLSEELCEAVNDSKGGTMLRQLESMNLFIVPLDDEGVWYRYHHLFRHYLNKKLTISGKQREIQLHCRAYQWFAQSGQAPQAVKHALAAGDIQSAAGFMEQCAIDLESDGHFHQVREWAEQLPDEVIDQSVKLQLAMALHAALLHRRTEALARLEKLESKSFENQQLTEFKFAIPTIRAVCESVCDRPQEAEKIIVEASLLDYTFSKNTLWALSSICNTLTHCYARQGRFTEARDVQIRLKNWPEEQVPLIGRVYADSGIGLSWLLQGEVNKAETYFRKSLEQIESSFGKASSIAAVQAGYLAEILYQRNEFESLIELIADNIGLVGETTYVDSVVYAHCNLASVFYIKGDKDKSWETIARGEALAARASWPRLTLACLLQRLKFAVRENDLTEIRYLENRMEDSLVEVQSNGYLLPQEVMYYSHFLKGYVALGLSNTNDAITFFEKLYLKLTKAGFHYHAFKTSFPLMTALSIVGRRDEAFKILNITLTFAGPKRLIRGFFDEGAPLLDLLKHAFEKQHSSLSADALIFLKEIVQQANLHQEQPLQPIEVLPIARPKPPVSEKTKVNNPIFTEQLSARETEILQLVAQGLTQKHAAKSLDITPETVKWHLKNIYGKLSVCSRVEAIQKARRSGFIE